LAKLTKLREHETEFLRELRRNYRAEVNKYIKDVTAPGSRADDLRRVTEDFENRMRGSLNELDRMVKRRTRIETSTFLETMSPGFSAAVVTYAASSSSLAAFLAGSITLGLQGIFKLVGSIPANAEKREEILRKNTAAWLYHVQTNAHL
jgi:hypothetical protein